MELVFNDVEKLLVWLEKEGQSNLTRIKMTASMKNFVPCYRILYNI